jgi:F-type H+-transporting ATPase subunit b
MKFIYSLLILIATPVAAFASESQSGGAHMVWRVVDFIIFAALIVYFVRKPIVNYFKNRKKQIFEEIENAKKAKEEAQNALNEAQNLLSKLSSEVESIIKIYKQMGEKEKEDYANAAKELEEIFKKRIEQEKAMILNKAYKNFIEKIISKAISKAREQFLSLNDQDLRNINKRYFDSFGVEYDK